jgi:hypothetical protein
MCTRRTSDHVNPGTEMISTLRTSVGCAVVTTVAPAGWSDATPKPAAAAMHTTARAKADLVILDVGRRPATARTT